MAKDKNNNKIEEDDESQEIIERLDPITPDEEDSEIDTHSVDLLFQEDEVTKDQSIDSLFEEERKSFQKGLQDEVQKALSQPVMSKASLYRMRMKEPSESDLTGDIAMQKTVEEVWEEPIDEDEETQNRKSIIVMCVFIALASIAGGWALWQSTNDERGNEEDLMAQETEAKQKEHEKRMLFKETNQVSELMSRYFSAITVAQKSESIYLAESLREDIESYYENNGGVKSNSAFSIGNIFPYEINGKKIWEVFVKDTNNLNKVLKSYFVRKNSDGDFKVDWKSDVIFQDNDIIKFKETRSKKATDFRFEVQPLNNMATYNWGFKDTEYQVFRLSIPDSDMVFWGYIKIGSDEQQKLHEYLESDLKNIVMDQKPKHQYILKVRFLEDSPKENDQYILIDDITSQKWVNTAE